MRRLGYDRYGTQGGDLGAYVAPAVARSRPEHVVGVHIDGGFGFPTEADVPEMTRRSGAEWEQMQQWMSGGVDHHALLRAAPQTFAYAWHDSPVGAAGLADAEVQGVHHHGATARAGHRPGPVLTNVSLYWFTGTSGSSSWPMYDKTAVSPGRRGSGGAVRRVRGPPAIRRLAERDNTIVHWPEGNPGSHFVAMEVPERARGRHPRVLRQGPLTPQAAASPARRRGRTTPSGRRDHTAPLGSPSGDVTPHPLRPARAKEPCSMSDRPTEVPRSPGLRCAPGVWSGMR